MSIEIDLSEISRKIGDDEFLQKYDNVTDDTVIPFLVECGLAPEDRGFNTTVWTDTAQTVLTYLCMKDERIEKTLFAALHDHIRALAVQDDESGVALVCEDCGEAFDDLLAAKEHDREMQYCANSYSILPRSEAF